MLGRISKSLVTETQNIYKDAGWKLQKSLDHFNRALSDVELRIEIGLPFPLSLRADGVRLDTNKVVKQTDLTASNLNKTLILGKSCSSNAV